MQYYLDQEEAAIEAKTKEDKERAHRVKRGDVNHRDPQDLELAKKAFKE